MTKISWLLLVCALALSGVAAYYSIIGLATIFSSAFWPVVTMAAILEVSKLVLASWLYQNWPHTPRLLKTYLTSAVGTSIFSIYNYRNATFSCLLYPQDHTRGKLPRAVYVFQSN